MKFEWWMFVVGAVLSWGIYVPVLHEGQAAMGDGKPSAGAVRAFLCVGLAYFVTAVVIPLIVLSLDWAQGEKLEFSDKDGSVRTYALTFATLGGIAGAAGALCIIFSIKYGGSPIYVAPLVFAGAPIVNAIVSVVWKWKPYYTDPSMTRGWLIFGGGILLAAIGAGLVLYSKGSLDDAAKELQKQEAKMKAAVAMAKEPPPPPGAPTAPPGAIEPH